MAANFSKFDFLDLFIFCRYLLISIKFQQTMITLDGIIKNKRATTVKSELDLTSLSCTACVKLYKDPMIQLHSGNGGKAYQAANNRVLC